MIANVTIGGRELVMRELTDGDHEALDEWVQARFVSVARASVSGERVGSPAWSAVMSVAMRDAAAMTWLRSPGTTMLLSTKAGIAKVVSQCCEPKLTIDEAKLLVKSRDDVSAVFEEFMQLNGVKTVERESPSKPDGSDPTSGGRESAAR